MREPFWTRDVSPDLSSERAEPRFDVLELSRELTHDAARGGAVANDLDDRAFASTDFAIASGDHANDGALGTIPGMRWERGAAHLSIAAICAVLSLTSCVPGHRGWTCSSDKDCNDGLECKDFGSSLFDNHYCASSGSTSIRSSETYGWVGLILVDGFAAFFALVIVVGAGAVALESIREKLGSLRRRSRPRASSDDDEPPPKPKKKRAAKRSPADKLVVVPGEGIAGIKVGSSSAEDVLAAFGDDCKVARHDDGKVFRISYDYDGTGKMKADRDENATRPCGFDLKSGVVSQIDVGVYQRELTLKGGIRVGSTLDEVVACFGDGYEKPPADDSPLDEIRYPTKGVKLYVRRESGKVTAFYVFVPEKS